MPVEVWPLLYGIAIRKKIKRRWIVLKRAFSRDEVEALTTIATALDHERSQDKYRKNTMGHIAVKGNEWLYRKYARIMCKANSEWGLGVSGFYQPIAACTYRKGGFIKPHTDYTPDSNTKLGMVVMLSKQSAFRGGELVFEDDRVAPRLMPGDAIVFPGYELHEVRPVTSGTRVVLTGWMQGPEWR